MIEVKNLTKRYGNHLAVNNISFTANDGEILGFLGLNGAGKTTTMNIMTGFLSATEGDVIVNGYDILDQPEKAKQSIGYLPDTPPLYGEMMVDEYLRFVCDIKKIKSSEREDTIERVKNDVKISEMGGRLIRNLSKGYRQRVGLAQAMIGNPKSLILDEPTSGLDPKQILEMRDLIRELGKKHTIVLSSHIMQEVSAMCTRIMIIDKGNIVASGTPDELASSSAKGHKMSVRFKGDENAISTALKSVPVFKKVTPIGSMEAGTYDFMIQGDNGIDVREAIFVCAARNDIPILMSTSGDPSLEQIFIQVTTGQSVASEGGRS